MDIRKELWSKGPEGQEIYRYTLKNAAGAYVQLSSIGAGVLSVVVPDRNGALGDVLMGYKDPQSYFGDGPCCGKCPGRYANRIAKGMFTLDGVRYSLPVNNGPNHLHGGPDGFMNKVWDSRIENGGVEFMYYSEDGEAGYPGNLKVVARYEWSEDNVLTLTFTAQTDKPTVVNLTNHSYFNLDCKGDIKSHILTLNAAEYLPTDDSLIPVGEPAPVAGTPMDFQNPKALGKDLFADFPALKYGKGYDNCWLIDGWRGDSLQKAAELYSPESGRVLEVLTTQPGVQVYAGCWLDGSPEGKHGEVYHDYDAVAIECQHFPDSPNEPDYPSTVLRPGETFNEAIVFAFSTR